MLSSAFLCLSKWKLLLVIFLYLMKIGYGWLPDVNTKLVNNANKITSISFRGNTSSMDHFTILYQDEDIILLGGRNQIYNLSLSDFNERRDSAIYWPSSEAHGQLCLLKGKSNDECQNYIRIFFEIASGKYLVCGTNSYKPLCRILNQTNGTMFIEREMEGIGLCPYDPEHNSTAIYTNNHLFSATVADFSGTDPLIYREPLRTELSDLKQLNAPNFVSSITYGDYIYFFFRETAVEYMNCGKIIYSRIARVCKHDKGGPHQSREKWTTFLKARLNCSVPGEYPFYFDEIQSTSNVVEGMYNNPSQIIYSVHTTPSNAIGGSAICIFEMKEVESVFRGPFKHQENLNANWLPFPDNKVPVPRPGECVADSRLLTDKTVNFIKSHPLMERAVPNLNGKPLLIRVSMNYRFTAIAVDPQVRTVNDETFDVIYVGTDDGKVLKIVNIPTSNDMKAVVISENDIFPKNVSVKQLRVAPGNGKVVVVSKDVVKLVTLNHCSSRLKCSDCIDLQDPHCAWDSLKSICVSVDTVTSIRYLIQDIKRGNISKCKAPANRNVAKPTKEYNEDEDLDTNSVESRETTDSSVDRELMDCNEVDDKVTGCASQSKLTLYTSEYLHIIVTVASLAGLLVGFLCGYLVSRRFHIHSQYPNSPFIEQHNHLDRLAVNQNSFLAPRNKTVNLDVLNVSTDSLPPKKDNLGSLKNLNITNEGTLQKIKKTYI